MWKITIKLCKGLPILSLSNLDETWYPSSHCVDLINEHSKRMVRPQWIQALQNVNAKPALTMEVAEARMEKAKAAKGVAGTEQGHHVHTC